MRYTLATDAAAIAYRLVQTVPELEHIKSARIAWLFTLDELKLGGGQKAAIISTPTVQGNLRKLFEWFLDEMTAELFDGDAADFLVRVSVGAWESIDAIRRERLVFHELCHLVHAEDRYGAPLFDDEGRPALKLVPHDTEVFHEEIRRYGVEVVGLKEHVAAIEEGERRERVRAFKTA